MAVSTGLAINSRDCDTSRTSFPGLRSSHTAAITKTITIMTQTEHSIGWIAPHRTRTRLFNQYILFASWSLSFLWLGLKVDFWKTRLANLQGNDVVRSVGLLYPVPWDHSGLQPWCCLFSAYWKPDWPEEKGSINNLWKNTCPLKQIFLVYM